VIVNADALQVYDGWRVLTARPSPGGGGARAALLLRSCAVRGGVFGGRLAPRRGAFAARRASARSSSAARASISGRFDRGPGGDPADPAAIRAEAEALAPEDMLDWLQAQDPRTAARIDMRNPARVRRAWEVLRATGRPLVAWQAETGPRFCRLRRCIGAGARCRSRLAERPDRATFRPDAGGRCAGGGARQPPPLGTCRRSAQGHRRTGADRASEGGDVSRRRARGRDHRLAPIRKAPAHVVSRPNARLDTGPLP
jgi:hypothetical protein